MSSLRFWKFSLLVCCLVGSSDLLRAADHVWQRGIWRDVQLATGPGGSITIPIGGLAPMTTVTGATLPGIPPTYYTSNTTAETQYVTIDGPDGLRYVARWNRRFTNVIINDPIDFVVEGTHLFVRGLKKGQAHKLDLVTTTRLPVP